MSDGLSGGCGRERGILNGEGGEQGRARILGAALVWLGGTGTGQGTGIDLLSWLATWAEPGQWKVNCSDLVMRTFLVHSANEDFYACPQKHLLVLSVQFRLVCWIQHRALAVIRL